MFWVWIITTAVLVAAVAAIWRGDVLRKRPPTHTYDLLYLWWYGVGIILVVLDLCFLVVSLAVAMVGALVAGLI